MARRMQRFDANDLAGAFLATMRASDTTARWILARDATIGAGTSSRDTSRAPHRVELGGRVPRRNATPVLERGRNRFPTDLVGFDG
jgi:hypothetical protein